MLKLLTYVSVFPLIFILFSAPANAQEKPAPMKGTVEGFDASDEEYSVTVSDQILASPLMDWISLEEKVVSFC